ncbi:hypothetical protein MKW94_018900 [Papaver nudicaule]|uniref:Mediator complex subunit 15 KIX domain-containing protein n=1 Tax=Papaver nudicaule TaxID=74823 RepID=A0AA41SGK5_PAPNU|nr:hypothetical protein [Papaver nudicaule]
MPSTVVDATDWRRQLQPSSRRRIITMIIETLKRHLLISDPEGLIELTKVATRFEQNVLSSATSQSDYLRIISSKMLVMEPNGVPNSSPLSTGGGAAAGGGGSQNPQDPPESVLQLVPGLHPVSPSQQQQQMNALSFQQSQLIGQQNNVQQELLNQQSIIANMQQHLLGNNTSHQQKQQLGQQSNMSGLQNQQQQPRHNTHRQGGTVQEQQNAQVSANSLQIQGKHAQQSQLAHQQINQVFQHQPNSLQRDMQQRIQTFGGSMLNNQSLLDQNQVSQKPASSTSMDGDATATGNAVNVQEETYQAIRSMREKYLPNLSEMHRRISQKSQQIASLGQPSAPEQIEKLKIYINMLDKFIGILNLPKSSVHPNYKDKLAIVEKQIVNILGSNRSRILGQQQQQILPNDGHPLVAPQQQQQIQPSGGNPLFIQQQQQQQIHIDIFI